MTGLEDVILTSRSHHANLTRLALNNYGLMLEKILKKSSYGCNFVKNLTEKNHEKMQMKTEHEIDTVNMLRLITAAVTARNYLFFWKITHTSKLDNRHATV